MAKVAVIGAGAWGTTLAIILAEKKHQVTLWAFEPDLIAEILEYRENKRFLPGYPLTDGVRPTANLVETFAAEIFFFVVPTQHLRSIARQFKTRISPAATIVSASKGIEDKTFCLPSEIISSEIGSQQIIALSGPNLSSEIAKGLPAAIVAAAKERALAVKVQESLMLERFRVYTNDDLIGVQLGGALKNVIAIAAGLADGLALGDNAKAALLVRGMAEISRLGKALGAREETFAGLSGMGDLITTCSSQLSRNHRVGQALAQGKKLSAILAETKTVAEGVPTTVAALGLSRKLGVNMPISQEVYNVLYEEKDPYQALTALMTRSATNE
ncbi:glycerol-3-phosphate dehydrogenase [candidate division WOR-1 bacterium RIFOXYB2_FULL_48_7]|uniref:Glycerol-3-phosphate dehydrogenase [NAD(P)+] n=1 Tax=candidate division WOR-1 bacterium RIFOXYB2_FULL_48_7 TaxID=1802583 RepID=A0A1F4TUC6_UNCSA|nr:MAG: glycerol-3-phosphate dehydrogenase [candidate division WOR-1 bacterium RIFOXYB2_FULL_48_7]